ncbi:AAA family ATPase [Gordonia humi]|uniref:AAA family ATPase n=1 Tax=Gordonia humi TaxID=686429 RepID=UPI00360DAB7C
MNRFSRIQISNWRQFRNVDVKFHNRLTVLTGANGSGKIHNPKSPQPTLLLETEVLW